MIELPAQNGIIRPWIVCEAADRWLNAVRRFAPEMMPQPLIPSIVPAQTPKARAILSGIDQAVVLWEVRRASLAACCDCLAAVAITSPRVLQLLAVAGLSDRERLVLSEYRCAAMIRQPEELPGLSRMIQGYFATTR
jgi:hypothetical protein